MNDFTARPAPKAHELAYLVGGNVEFDPAIEDYVIRVGEHVITSTFRGAVVLDAHSPDAVELGRFSDGVSRLAAAFRMATTGAAA